MHPLLGSKSATRSTSSWSDSVSDTEAHARAGGRARYNHERQLTAAVRRAWVVRRYIELNAARGAMALIAEELQVHRSTIMRDIRRWSGEQTWPCPTCLQPVANDDWTAIVQARKDADMEDALSDGAQARRDAARIIRDELPRVLADIGIFIDDPDDLDGDIVIPSTTLDQIADRLTATAEAA